MKKIIKTLFLMFTLCFCFAGAGTIVQAKSTSADCIYRYDYAFEILDYLNAERAKIGLSALKMDQSLTDVAMTRASELTIRYDHYRPDGTYFTSAGGSSWLKSENIAYGYSTPKEANTAWTNSPTHYEAMTGNFTGVGIGCVQAADGTFYWTEEFGVYRSAAKQKENYSTISAKNLKVTISKIENKKLGVKLTWNSVLGADGYIVYRKQSGGTYKKLAKTNKSTKTTFKDTTVKNAKKYSYKVLPYTKSDGKTGKCDAKTTVWLKQPTITSVSCNENGSVTVKWKKASDVAGYCVTYSKDSSFSNSSFTYVGKNKTKTTLNDIPSSWNKVYVYVSSYVKLKKDVITTSPKSKIMSTKIKQKTLSTPVIKSTESKSTGHVTLSWSAVSDADEYRVYYSTKKDFSKDVWYYTVSSSKTSFTVPSLESGKTYYFRIQAINEDNGKTIKSEYSSTVSAKTK